MANAVWLQSAHLLCGEWRCIVQVHANDDYDWLLGGVSDGSNVSVTVGAPALLAAYKERMQTGQWPSFTHRRDEKQPGQTWEGSGLSP